MPYIIMRTFEILLNCSSQTALNILRQNTDPARGFRVFGILGNSSYWAILSDQKAVIWPKGGKDISSTKLKFDIVENKEGTLLKGQINHFNFINIPTWLLGLSIFLYFIGFVLSAILFLTGNETFPTVLTFSIAAFLIFFIGLMQRFSKGQEEQLEGFIQTVFKNEIKIINFA